MMLLPTQQHRTEHQSLCCRYLAVDEARSCFTSGNPAFVPMHNPDTDVSTAPACMHKGCQGGTRSALLHTLLLLPVSHLCSILCWFTRETHEPAMLPYLGVA